jgi:hypothetical protein
MTFCARVEACLYSTTAPLLNCSSPNPRRGAAPSIAVEDLRVPKAFGAWLEVGDERFSSGEIQRLYEAEDYPLRKP